MTATNQLSVYHAIYGRRSAWKFSDRPVDWMAIARMLDAAVWAPKHRLTEPWRSFAGYQLGRTRDIKRAEAARPKAIVSPVVMYIYSVPGTDEATTKENYASECISARNISLSGPAEGLAVTWETGRVTRHPGLGELLGAEETWETATMLLIGHPGEHPVSRRSPSKGFVQWFEA